ncbi:uncharacterized protein LOC119345518 [Triticum dicoccoides]|uniref:uncharacterized protein LOC119345518 n=1 Tax=Triticum dicoccoides TaxID=85692 RepID=UPI00188F9C27|nr:uncharacterized protein LOC119345518 [Triticum dicoccoides]
MSPRLTKTPRLQVLGMSPRRPTSSTSSEFPKCLTLTATACTTRRMMASSPTPAPSSPTPGRGPVHDSALPLLLLLPTVAVVADWSMHDTMGASSSSSIPSYCTTAGVHSPYSSWSIWTSYCSSWCCVFWKMEEEENLFLLN